MLKQCEEIPHGMDHYYIHPLTFCISNKTIAFSKKKRKRKRQLSLMLEFNHFYNIGPKMTTWTLTLITLTQKKKIISC